MGLPFAYELGEFDPNFPGITLHYPNEAAWRKVREVSALNYILATRGSGSEPLASTEGMDPARMMSLLLEDADVGIHLSPREKDEIGRKFVARDPDNAVANLAVASAFEHERRHFHDWLLSPYTTGISQIRSEVFANYAALRGAL